MNSLDVWTILLSTIGLCFFITGTLGLLRFPDVFCRLHALTKADNLGLGLSLIPHLRAHETKANLVCRLLLEKKKKTTHTKQQKKTQTTHTHTT